jgi:hypothetical protein
MMGGEQTIVEYSVDAGRPINSLSTLSLIMSQIHLGSIHTYIHTYIHR